MQTDHERMRFSRVERHPRERSARRESHHPQAKRLDRTL